MRWIPIFLLAYLVGCPNDYSPPGEEAVVGHPWDLPSSDYPFPEPKRGWGVDPGHPILPEIRQPDFPDTDYDPALLPGSWLQLAISNPDGVTRRPLEAMHQIDFTRNGKLVYHRTNDGDEIATSGAWEKTSPGMILFTLGENEGATFTFRMHKEEFFFFASGNPPQGYWFAKLPEIFTEKIMANRFQTDLGELHLSEVVGNSFSGTVSGSSPMEFTGVYKSGVLLLEWVEQDSGNNGFAALIVDPDWTHFEGIWWINDFEAAPFGGEWTGTVTLPGP